MHIVAFILLGYKEIYVHVPCCFLQPFCNKDNEVFETQIYENVLLFCAMLMCFYLHFISTRKPR